MVGNGDFRVGTPYSGTMRLVFAQKGDGTEGQGAAITVTLEIPSKPKCLQHRLPMTWGVRLKFIRKNKFVSVA